MGMRETKGSLQAYFLVVGCFSTGRALLILTAGEGLETTVIVGLILDLLLGIAFILCGVFVRRLLAEAPGVIVTLLAVMLAIAVILVIIGALLFARLQEPGILIVPLVQVLITVYLLVNVNRLARESVRRPKEE